MTNFCGGRTSKILPWYPMHASACMGMPGYAWACPFGYLFGLSFVFLNWFSKSLMIFTFLNVMKLTGHARACLGIYRHARACPFGYLFGPSFVFVNWFSKSQMIFTFLNDMKLTRHAWACPGIYGHSQVNQVFIQPRNEVDHLLLELISEFPISDFT